MTARDDHAARVLAGVSEPGCWAALFDEIDQLRARSLCGECGGPLVSMCDDCGTVHG